MARTATQPALGPAVVMFLAALALAAPRAASAQAPQVDPRWHAWVGCWTASQNVPAGAAARTVCVVPAQDPSTVELVTLGASGVVSRERIQANGERRASEREGCTGWETAQWSADSHRIYLRSEHQCAGGAKRSSHALMAINPQGEWLDVVSVTIGETTGTRVLRHRPTVGVNALPGESAASLQRVSPANAIDARTAASAVRLTLADVIDASKQLNASAVVAWLNDLRQDFTIDGKKLVQLADAGVPDRVVDLLVALAYPDAFSVPPSPTSVGSLASSERDSGGGGFSDFGGVDTFGCANDFSVYGWDRCAPFSYAPFGILAAGVLPYAFGPYGGYGGGYGGWYTGNPGVIVIRGDGPHGQVVNGRGYTANTGGATATPTTSAGSSSSSGTTSTASAPASSSGGTSSSSGSSSSGGDRTAHPR